MLRGFVGVGHAGGRTGGAARAPRHDAGRDLGRIRWSPGVPVGGLASPRGGGGRRGLVDQRWRLRPAVAGYALLRGLPGRGLARRHGRGRRAAGMGRGDRAELVEPPALPRPGPGRVHPHHGALDGGLLPARRGAHPRPAGRRRPRHGHPRPGVPERRERPAPHPGDLGGAGLDAAAGPAGRATLGGPRVDRATGGAGRGAVRRAGPCWPRNYWSGRPRPWAEAPRLGLGQPDWRPAASFVAARRGESSSGGSGRPRARTKRSVNWSTTSSKSTSIIPCTNHISGKR